MSRSKCTSTAIVMALLATAATLRAESAEPLALQGVMQQLGRDMQTVAGAIATEDWGTVAERAPKIARHAEPPITEKLRILNWVGSDAGKFRGFDGEVHDAATAMEEAAMRGDGKAVIKAFSKVQLSCLGCHQNFREPFIKHFNGPR
ncbi:cytochrome c [Marinobacter sp.]|uniref:cytochrome c n=1 Tax=Marinobacter sp. TaxID=50741 RepID=UPI003A9220D8